MLLEHSTGLDLNSPEEQPIGIDILWDVPQVISVARIRYPNGTRVELSYCPTNSDDEDMNIARCMIPSRAMRLRGFDSAVLGCDCMDEHTFAFWIFE